ncbi:unnamed protein product, partial [Prorocentrum cordatum]
SGEGAAATPAAATVATAATTTEGKMMAVSEIRAMHVQGGDDAMASLVMNNLIVSLEAHIAKLAFFGEHPATLTPDTNSHFVYADPYGEVPKLYVHKGASGVVLNLAGKVSRTPTAGSVYLTSVSKVDLHVTPIASFDDDAFVIGWMVPEVTEAIVAEETKSGRGVVRCSLHKATATWIYQYQDFATTKSVTLDLQLWQLKLDKVPDVEVAMRLVRESWPTDSQGPLSVAARPRSLCKKGKDKGSQSSGAAQGLCAAELKLVKHLLK